MKKYLAPRTSHLAPRTSHLAPRTSHLAILIASVASLLAAGAVKAQTTYLWNTNTNNGNWQTSGNWSPNGVPGADDIAAFINETGATSFGIDFSGATGSGNNNGANGQIVGEIQLQGSAARTIGAGTSTNGTLTLAGVNGVLLDSYSGYALTLAPNVNSAIGVMTVALGESGSVIVDNSGSITISANITDSGNNYSLTKTGTGSGQLVLSGSNSYTGGTIIQRGTINLNFSAAGAPTSNILSSSGALTLSGGTLLLTGSANTTNSQTVSQVTFGSGASAITLTATTSNPLSLNLNAITRDAGATVNFTNPTGTISAANGISTTSGSANSILIDAATGAAYATVSGTDWAAVNSTGQIVGLSTISGYTTFTAGSVTLTGNADLTGAVGTYTLAGASTPTTIRNIATASNIIDLAGNVLQTGGILSSQNLTITDSVGGGSLQAAQAGGELVLDQTGSTTTITAAITNNSSASALTKTGGGTVILTSTGGLSTYKTAYTGATTVNAGTLDIGNTGENTGIAGASGGVFTVNGGTLQFNAYSTTFTTATGAGTGITINAGGTLNLYQDNGSTGTTAWTLPSITLNNEGTLKFQTALGNVTNNLAANISTSGTTTIDATGEYDTTMNLSGVFSGSGTVNYTVIGASFAYTRALTLSNAANTFNGNWIVADTSANAGDVAELVSGAVGALGTGTVTLNGAATLTTTLNNGLNSLSAVSLTTASSTLTTGNYTWQNTNAAVSMSAGLFNVGSATTQIGSLNGTGGTIQSSGTTAGFISTLQVSSGSYSGVIANGNANATFNLTKYGSGTFTLGGVNTYTGNTTVSAGGFTLASTGALAFALANSGSSNQLTIATGATLTLQGTFNINATNVTDSTDTWTLVSNSNGSNNVGLAGLSLITASGTTGFTNAGSGIWTDTVNGSVYTYTESTGVLTLAVPEPSTIALTLIFGAGMLLLFRRRFGNGGSR